MEVESKLHHAFTAGAFQYRKRGCSVASSLNGFVYCINGSNLLIFSLLEHLEASESSKLKAHKVIDSIKPIRSIDLGKEASFVLINCDNSVLALGVSGEIILVSLESLQNSRSGGLSDVLHRRIALSAETRDLSFSPTHPELLAVVLESGLCQLFSASADPQQPLHLVGHVAAEQDARCVCWSPKGKQLAVALQGSAKFGDTVVTGPLIMQLSPADMRCKKVVQLSAQMSAAGYGDAQVFDIAWSSSAHFLLAVAKAEAAEAISTLCLHVKAVAKQEARVTPIDCTRGRAKGDYRPRYFLRLAPALSGRLICCASNCDAEELLCLRMPAATEAEEAPEAVEQMALPFEASVHGLDCVILPPDRLFVLCRSTDGSCTVHRLLLRFANPQDQADWLKNASEAFAAVRDVRFQALPSTTSSAAPSTNVEVAPKAVDEPPQPQQQQQQLPPPPPQPEKATAGPKVETPVELVLAPIPDSIKSVADEVSHLLVAERDQANACWERLNTLVASQSGGGRQAEAQLNEIGLFQVDYQLDLAVAEARGAMAQSTAFLDHLRPAVRLAVQRSRGFARRLRDTPLDPDSRRLLARLKRQSHKAENALFQLDAQLDSLAQHQLASITSKPMDSAAFNEQVARNLRVNAKLIETERRRVDSLLEQMQSRPDAPAGGGLAERMSSLTLRSESKAFSAKREALIERDMQIMRAMFPDNCCGTWTVPVLEASYDFLAERQKAGPGTASNGSKSQTAAMLSAAPPSLPFAASPGNLRAVAEAGASAKLAPMLQALQKPVAPPATMAQPALPSFEKIAPISTAAFKIATPPPVCATVVNSPTAVVTTTTPKMNAQPAATAAPPPNVVVGPAKSTAVPSTTTAPSLLNTTNKPPTTTTNVTPSSTVAPSLSGEKTAPGGLFGAGSSVPSGGMFGQPGGPVLGTQTATTIVNNFAQPGGGLFGVPTTTTSGSKGAFGSPTTTAATGLFGLPPSSTTAPSGLFAKTTATTSAGLFGSPAATTAAAAPTGGIFGAADVTTPATTQATGGLFGGASATTAAAPTASPGIFGSALGNAANSSGIFDTPVKPAGLFGTPSTTTSAAPSGLFGSQAANTTASSSGGLFGSAGGTTSTALFGSKPATSASTGLFGAATTVPSTGLFGNPATTAASSGGLFGNPATTAASSGGLFGAPAATTTSSGGLFGSQAPASSGGLFGSSGAGAPNLSSMFGGSAMSFGSQQQSAMAQPAANVFGKPTGGSNHVPQGLFGSPQSQQNNSPFGAKPASGAGGGGGGLFGSSSPGSGSLFGAAPTFGSPAANLAANNPLMFAPTNPNGSAAAPTGGLFASLATSPNTATFGSLSGGQQQPKPAGLFGASPSFTQRRA